MIRSTFLLSACILLLAACEQKSPTEKATEDFKAVNFQKDLENIKKKGKLRALTTYSSTSYFLYKGEPMGYEYELLQRFADHLDVDLEIIVADDINTMIDQLNSGKADIIAHGLTVTSERKEKVLFTDYLYLVKQVLVQKKPDNWRRMQK
ncbi:MAG: transporter substrate-binding domain-containing protein [Flavobacteriales bacterium]|nr:transporter substrate-binding domain-containing protein [Flavobacteriales bacterium]